MIRAATELYDTYFLEWQLCNRAFDTLRASHPCWDEELSLLKAVAINQLYGTNVYSIVPLARNVAKVMSERPVHDVSLVARLATYPESKSWHVSFASKLCHFFIDAGKYPIFDEVACDTLKLFLDNQYSKSEPRYEHFLDNLDRLRAKFCALKNLDNIEVDRFLWLFGLWKRFDDHSRNASVEADEFKKKGVAKINAEARRVFTDGPAAIARLVGDCETA